MSRSERLRAAALAALTLSALLGAALPARAGGPSFTIRGRGWGHGVGMSQWGARGLADAGWRYPQILGLFYRGTAIQQLPEPATIRVGLLQEQNQVDVTANGDFHFYDNNGVDRAVGHNGETWHVQPLAQALTVTDANNNTVFTSPAPVMVRYERFGSQLLLPQTGRWYRHGGINFEVNLTTGKERAVLGIPFEQYLYGIAEMPSSWHIEALKAQAIAARTYAVEKVIRLGQNRSVCACGVYASTADQVYAGASQEVQRWVIAVDQTRGSGVTYNGNAIQAYYSSSDGGYSENNENAFGGDPLPYLRGTCDVGDYYGGRNPVANWSVTMDGDQIGSRLGAGGYSVGSVSRIQFPLPRGVSGRVLRVLDADHGGVAVTGSGGSARVSGGSFSALLGLRSTLIMQNISGAIRLRYDSLRCEPGLPLSVEYTWHDLNGAVRGSAQNFTNGRLFRNASTGKVFYSRGAILARYDAERSRRVDLGMPLSDGYATTYGGRQDFERGYITWSRATRQTSVVLYH